GANSFTVDCWVKTDTLAVPYNLVSKLHPNGDAFPDFTLRLLPSGTLQGQVINYGLVTWKVEQLHTTYVIDDNQWHSISMVVDRTGKKLKLYVDGSELASSDEPLNFGPMRNLGQTLKVGINNASGP